MSKGLVFIRDVISQYHPKFQTDAELTRMALEDPSMFNVERLIEHTLAHVGRMRFVDAEGYDFLPDYSDSKTVSVNTTTGQALISSVENKIGPLRITCYNPVRDRVDFFYVPKSHLNRVRSPCYGKQSHKERVLFNYSFKFLPDYGWFEEYRVDSFKKLARARG